MAEGRAGRRRKSGRKAAKADAVDVQDDDAAAAADQPDADVQNGVPPADASSPSGSGGQDGEVADGPAAASRHALKLQPTAQPDAASWRLPTWLLQAFAMALIAWATTALTGACRCVPFAASSKRCQCAA
jgi:hypothetical protein